MSEIADYDQLIYEIETLLRTDRRIAYWVLKRKIRLDDEDIEDIKAALIDAKHIAVDEDAAVLADWKLSMPCP